MYRYARAARIYDGPDEVHRQSVARQHPARLRGARRRRAERARADAARGRARALRRAARGGDLERLSGGRLGSRGIGAALAAAIAVVAVLAARRRRRLVTAPPAPRPAAAPARVDRFDSRPRVGRAAPPGRARAAARPARARCGGSPSGCGARCRAGASSACPAIRGCATSSACSRARSRRSSSPPTTTRRRCPGFVGANDGAAGTAAVSSSPARCAGPTRPAGAPELRFVLFDGEEATDDRRPFDADRPARLDRLRRAPRRRARRADPARLRRRARTCASGARRTRTRALWAELRARRGGRSARGAAFPPGTGGAITDDHVAVPARAASRRST